MSTRIRNIGFPRPPIRFDTVFSPKILTRATIIGSRPQSSSASQTLVNPEALTDRLELIRNENGQRIDKDLNVDPSSAKYGTVRSGHLCGWYYLRGACLGSCGKSHSVSPLNAQEFDCLWHLIRADSLCDKVRKCKDCEDPKCIYGHRQG